MITLKDLCRDLKCDVIGNRNLMIRGISCHSFDIKPGYLFVAINGYRTSGKKYIESAIKKGAMAIATSDYSLTKIIANKYNHRITTIHIENPRQFLALAANRFYKFPSKKLNLIGITGTDGKTTTSYMIKSIIEASGEKTGLLGTIKYFDGKNWLAAPNTTPETVVFIKFLSNLVKKNVRYCISEVSSHALELDRVTGLDFKAAILTNLAQDHLDFHKTKKAYGEAKLKLFKNLSSSSYAIVNNDDKFTKSIIKKTKAKIITYGITKPADITGKIKNVSLTGTNVEVKLRYQSKSLAINLPMPGRHNVYNMLAAIGAVKTLKISNNFIRNGFEQLKPVAGRLERILTDKGYNIYIDYAHTEEALNLAIRTLKDVTKGKVIVVFGCGGNRDCLKRPKMGKIATELSDYVIITSDNPRHESPKSIIEDIRKGIKKNNFESIIDRTNAIKKALLLAKPSDAVLVAGKGHEDYQIIGDKKIPFSDKEIVLKELKKV